MIIAKKLLDDMSWFSETLQTLFSSALRRVHMQAKPALVRLLSRSGSKASATTNMLSYSPLVL